VGQKRYTTHTVSFSGQEQLLADARAVARSQRRSLSNYIRGLLEADLKAGLELKDSSQPAAPPPARPVNSKAGSDPMIEVGPHGAVSYRHQRRAKKYAGPPLRIPIEPIKS